MFSDIFESVLHCFSESLTCLFLFFFVYFWYLSSSYTNIAANLQIVILMASSQLRSPTRLPKGLDCLIVGKYLRKIINKDICTSTRQNVPSDILTILVESSKKRKNDIIYVLEITLYL